MDRRDFLTGSVGAALLATLPADVCAQTGSPPRSAVWDSGRVRHLLPTVSDTRMLIKVSLMQPLSAPPVLRVGGRPVAGRMNDTGGEFWQFHIDGLEPGRRYALSLAASGGAALCQPWDLSTFPDPNARPTEFRVLFFTCACGHDAFGFLPASIRSRLLHARSHFALTLPWPTAIMSTGIS
jgi:hypothetical protein